jgi:type 2 lantibiotic biosynthesis protein LanM
MSTIPTPTPVRAATWAGALTLRERLAGLERSSHTASERAARRMQRWQTQAPFGDPDLFNQRLAVDGLTPERLLGVLDEPVEQVAERTPDATMWADDLLRAYAEFHSHLPSDPDTSERALLVVLEPLIEQAREKLARGARGIAARSERPLFDPASIGTLLDEKLPRRLFSMLARCMALELHTASSHGALSGDTPAERFRSFVEYLADPDGALDFLGAYPVLARQISICLDQWVESSLEFLDRLVADADAIRASFDPSAHDLTLTAVDCALGDFHASGRAVMIATFDSGVRVVYKPKPLGVEQHFQELLEWVNGNGGEPAFRRLVVLDRGAYGWVECVRHAECTSRAGMGRFYARMGGLLALLRVLAATDLHYENIIAAGEDPIVVDLEALFHPSLSAPNPADAYFRAVGRIEESVLSVGLLPQPTRLSPGSPPLDVSGLGATDGQLSLRGAPRWVGGATDTGRVEYQRQPLNPGQHRPTLDGQPAEVLEYAGELLDGFTRTYRLLLAHRDRLLADDGPLARFADDEVRPLLRPTVVYARLLMDSFHPDLLRDALERDRFFDRLWVAVPYQPRLVAAIAAEQADLLRGDIPRFSTRPGSREVRTSSGESLHGIIEESGLSVARRRVEALGEADLEQQLWFARAALGALPNVEEASLGAPVVRQDAPDREQFLRAARSIGDRLEQLAIHGEDDATWIGLTGAQGGQSATALGSDLYAGLPGVVLFLAYLGQVSGELRYTGLARAGLISLRRQLASVPDPVANVGAFEGWGGVIYTLTHLASIWHEPAMLAEAVEIARRLAGLVGPAPGGNVDVIGGTAGALGALVALYASAPSDDVLQAAIQCGDHVLANAQPMPSGIGWPSAEDEGAALTGFAHGAAGIAWSLLHLESISGLARFGVAARSALDYERSLYSAQDGNWPDLRAGGGVDRPAGYMVAWCHGAPGIGLARLATRGLHNDGKLQQEIDAAVSTTLLRGSGFSHALCHGDLGNVDLLLTAATALGEPRLQREAERWAAGILHLARNDGWLCATPLGLESPGLMTGLAGIGYELLRLVEPRRVPSVLTLEPPPPFGPAC